MFVVVYCVTVKSICGYLVISVNHILESPEEAWFGQPQFTRSLVLIDVICVYEISCAS